MTQFSTSADISINRSVALGAEQSHEHAFELDKCIAWINENALTKICLQFSDLDLGVAVEISHQIEIKTNSKIFILADTSYASCCVDTTAAKHVDADGLIHFGPACLMPHSGIPVLHVYRTAELHIEKFCDAIQAVATEPTRIFYETKYHKYLSALKERLTDNKNITVCALCDDGDAAATSPEQSVVVSGRRIPSSCCAKRNVFLGADSMLLTNLVLIYPDATWYVYDEEDLKEHSFATSKFLMKRIHLVEKLKDASAIGILVGTLSVAGTLEAVDRVRALCKQSGKKCYTVAVGRPNVAKLANLPEINAFVLISCPENKLLLEAGEYYQPIVSLMEVELALGGRQWAPEYSLDFRQFQPGGQFHREDTDRPYECEVDMSLISGKMRQEKPNQLQGDVGSSAVVAKSLGEVVESHAAQFLAGRSWGGLEQKLGETSVEKAVQGRRGVPLGYKDEGASNGKLRILCLHGYRQDGSKLRQQSGALRKLLKNLCEFEFLSAPFEVPQEGESSRSWWFTAGESFSSRDEPEECTGLTESIKLIEDRWTNSNFDGLLGFSQGACLVSIINAMYARKLLSLSPKFVIIISGFKSLCKSHSVLYEDVIKIPSLHIFGESDQVIPFSWSENLAGIYEKPTIINHSGGHFVPGSSNLKDKYYAFMQEQMKH